MLTNDIITLRPLIEKDADFLFSWRNNLENIRLTQGFRFPKHFLKEKDWVERVSRDTSNKAVHLMIEDVKTSETVGYIHLSSIDSISRTCTYGIVIPDKVNRKKGYADQAMILAIKYAFEILNLRKITSHILASNNATIRYVEKHNFIQEGILKEHYYWNNKYEDILIFSIIHKN